MGRSTSPSLPLLLDAREGADVPRHRHRSPQWTTRLLVHLAPQWTTRLLVHLAPQWTTSASVLMTWTTSARFTDAPGPKVIALTAARYQPHPSFRTALLSSEHARSSPQGSTTAPRRPAVPAANAHASTPPPNPL